jgi:hypothetical protein
MRFTRSYGKLKIGGILNILGVDLSKSKKRPVISNEIDKSHVYLSLKPKPYHETINTYN